MAKTGNIILPFGLKVEEEVKSLNISSSTNSTISRGSTEIISQTVDSTRKKRGSVLLVFSIYSSSSHVDVTQDNATMVPVATQTYASKVRLDVYINKSPTSPIKIVNNSSTICYYKFIYDKI